MSDLVINELTPVDKTKLITKNVKIAKYAQYGLGIRMWYVLFDTDGTSYQRYSLAMNPTDEVLLTVKVGDTIQIQYYPDHVEDSQYQRFEPFDRNTIVYAKYV